MRRPFPRSDGPGAAGLDTYINHHIWRVISISDHWADLNEQRIKAPVISMYIFMYITHLYVAIHTVNLHPYPDHAAVMRNRLPALIPLGLTMNTAVLFKTP